MCNVYFCDMKKETKIYGLRAIIEAVEAENTIDKVFLQKGLSGELYTELEKLLKKQNINVSYVPVEKLNSGYFFTSQRRPVIITPFFICFC